MAETQPNKGNEGAGKERVAELKQINIEAAKVEANLRGVAAAFKDIGEFSKEGVKSSQSLTGFAQSLAKSYKKNTDFAKELSGLTANQLADSKTRGAFEKKVLGIQNEQASVAAQIVALKEEEDAINLAIGVSKEQNAAADIAAKASKAEYNRLVQEEGDMRASQIAEAKKLNEINAKAFSNRAEAADKVLLAELALEDLENSKIDVTQKQLDIATEALDKAYEEEHLLTEKMELNKRIMLSAEEELATKQEQLNKAKSLNSEAQELLETESQTLTTFVGQKTAVEELTALHKTAKEEIDGQVNAAEALQAEMKKIDEAGGSFLRGLEDISKVMGGIPILGDAVGAIFGQLTTANKAYTDAVAKGISKTKARYKVLAGSIQAIAVASLTAFIKLAVDGIFKMSDATAAVQKGLGATSLNAASQMGAVSAAAGKLKIPLSEAAALIGQMNDGIGMNLVQTKENVLQFGLLTKKYGVAAGSASKLQMLSAKTGNNYKDFTDSIAVGTERFNANNKVAISSKVIYEGIANASDSVLANIGKNKNALIQAATQARMLGLEMDDIAAAAESTLDFESSLAKEMEAELMLGKELNLDKLRAAAANGDVASQAAEINRLVSENKDSIGDNVMAQDAFAKSIGLTRDQYIKARDSGDALKTMTAESGATAAKNAANAKKSDAELQAGIDKSVSKMTGLSDAMAKFKENMALGAGSFAMDILNGFKKDGFIDGMKNLFTKVWTGIKEGFTNIFDDKAISGSTMGKLLGSLAIAAGGATIAIKAASGIKDMLFGKKGSRASNPLHTTGGKGSALGDIMKMSTRSPKWLKGFKGLSKVFGGKTTIVGKQLRNVAAMMGKNQSFAGQVFKNLGSKSNMLSKVFSGITKTGGGLTKVFTGVGPKIATSLGGVSKFIGPALKGIGGKILAPLEIAMGAFTGASQVAGKTIAEKEAVGIRGDMGATEGGILGALTGNANKGSMLSSMVGIEEGSAGDEALGIASAAGRGALTGAALTAWLGPGAAIGAAVGGVIGGAAESFKVFSDPNSKLRKGITEFASNTWSKAKEIGSKVKETAFMVGSKIKDFAVGVKDRAVEVAGRIKDFAVGVKNKAFEVAGRIKDFAVGVKDKAVAFARSVGQGISNFASTAKDKISSFASSVGDGIMSFGAGIANFASSAVSKISDFKASIGAGIKNFADAARDKAKAFAGAIGEKIGNIRGKISDFLDANDGLVGGIRAAATGLASKASNWFGSKVKSLKSWWNEDKKADKTKSVSSAAKKQVETPVFNMTDIQATRYQAALKQGLLAAAKHSDKTAKIGSEFIADRISDVDKEGQNLKSLKKQNDTLVKTLGVLKTELKNQTALLYQQVANPANPVIKMNGYQVGQQIWES
tara:strand:+ start:26708 stop:30835 length:4128 start_codon:yes stop_codon:yes gene_type:complete